MIKNAAVCLALAVLFTVAACAVAAESAPKGISQADMAGKPTVFATVKNPPDPQLLGGWKCTWERFRSKSAEYETNPVEYFLVKHGDKYGLFFYRNKPSANKVYAGWRDWVIDGKEIKSDTGVTIFTANGEVFFKWQSDEPVKMTRIENN